jgi:hypothetical protein
MIMGVLKKWFTGDGRKTDKMQGRDGYDYQGSENNGRMPFGISDNGGNISSLEGQPPLASLLVLALYGYVLWRVSRKLETAARRDIFAGSPGPQRGRRRVSRAPRRRPHPAGSSGPHRVRVRVGSGTCCPSMFQ